MNQLPVKNQVRLSPMRCLQLTIAGISYRLFRSLVTVTILALAVTFLAQGLSHSLIVHETRFEAYQQLRETRELGTWISRLTTADERRTIWDATAAENENRLIEYANWSNAETTEMAKMIQAAQRLREIRGYFGMLPEDTRVILLSGREVVEVVRQLGDQQRRTEFAELLEALSLPEIPGGMDSLGTYAREDLPQLQAWTDRVIAGHQRAIRKVRESQSGSQVNAWFTQASQDLADALVSAGYSVNPEALSRLRVSAEDAQTLEQIRELVMRPEASAAIIRRLDVLPRDLSLELVIDYVDTQARAEWLSELFAGTTSGEARLASEEILRATSSYRLQQRLQDAAGQEASVAREGLFDLPLATRWLMILSFMVCAVGVANAMFMSVTERFTEIATMKCLGALDGFLMQMFIFESALQGIAGALVGIVLGIGIAMIRGMASYGGLVWEAMPWVDLLLCAVLSILAGLILAVAAAVGPAWMAARLAPMEAMRIE